MEEANLRRLLEGVADGSVAPDDAVAALRRLPFADLGFARVDHHRNLRQGAGETVYGPGKAPAECVAIVGELLDAGASPVMLTRPTPEQAEAVLAAHPGGRRCGTVVVWRPRERSREGTVLVASAGTADGPVAAECSAVLTAHGVGVEDLRDVGVAGLHRLLADLDVVTAADVVVVVAGMEGALASVIGGLTAAPVVAVPTSVGYGAGLDGITALLAMLSSCASGLTVVGIDNGFGAAMAALRILGPGAGRGASP